jgi:alpha-N-arabinofuranosidase
MKRPLSRRNFISTAAAVSATALLPKRLFSAASSATPSSATRRVTVRADSEIGVVRPEFHGHFVEHLGSCVYGGLWVGKNSRIPNIEGYRKQAVEYLKDLGVPVLRWPGGCFADDYHWRDGIGAAAKRPKRVNIHWGNYVEDGSFGTHEFIGLCRLLGAEPYLAGNVGSSTPHELRDWIEYCNYPSGSTLSDERAANGSPEPFRVRYWGVGNESWGCGGNMRPEEYARLYRDFAVYCREFGGTELFLVASGPSGDDTRWSRGLMDGLGWERPQGVSMHYYTGGADLPTGFTANHVNEQLAIYAKVEESIIHQRAVLDSYEHGHDVGLILDEWGVWDQIPEEDEKRYGKLWQQSTMRSAVAAGLGLNIFNRQADKLYMCNIAQMVNVLQSLLVTDGPEGEHCVRTTTYHAFSLFKPHRAKTAVRVEADAPEPLGLSVSASRSDKELVVTFVNPHHDTDLQVECAIRGGRVSAGTARILHDPDWNAFNGFDNPNRVAPKQHPVRVNDAGMELELPKLSVVTAVVPIR